MIGGTNAVDYKSIGEHFLDIFVRYGGLKATDRVLDVGSGCGRMATPLTEHLTSGTYNGIEIVHELVEWCIENIEPRFPRFRFHHIDLFNYEYNKSGKVQPKDFQFPFPDNSFDFVFLTSVFTHMLPDDMRHYTREIYRTLVPGGRAVITFFIINEESLRLQETRDAKVRIAHPFLNGEIMVTDPTRPEAVTAYPEATIRQALLDAKLALQEPIYFGSWCGRRNTVTYQDLTISRKI
jgi:SAM-dependent methyltransferase